MPLYEYYCTDCRGLFEKLVHSAEATSPACPDCGGSHVSKMVSTFSAFSGSDGQPDPVSGGCACGGACACRN